LKIRRRLSTPPSSGLGDSALAPKSGSALPGGSAWQQW